MLRFLRDYRCLYQDTTVYGGMTTGRGGRIQTRARFFGEIGAINYTTPL